MASWEVAETTISYSLCGRVSERQKCHSIESRQKVRKYIGDQEKADKEQVGFDFE